MYQRRPSQSAMPEATARARGRVHGRPATAVAGGIVDCGGRLWYSTLTVRRHGRTLQTLRDLAPC